jgi:hypothetical protein
MVTFDMTSQIIKEIQQAATALSVKYLTLTESDGKIIGRVHQIDSDRSNNTEDYFDFVVGDKISGSAENCMLIIDIDTIPKFDGDYTVSVEKEDPQKIMFTSKSINLSFWTTLHQESTME